LANLLKVYLPFTRTMIHLANNNALEQQHCYKSIKLDWCRYFRSVSIFDIFGIFKVDIGIGIGIFPDHCVILDNEKTRSQFPFSALSLLCPDFQTVSLACSS